MSLFRIAKRLSSLGETNPDEVCKVEFRDRDGHLDLGLSLYELNGRDEVIRGCVEHAAGIPLMPPRKCGAFDLTALVHSVRACPTEVRFRFEFASQRHRELVGAQESDLRAFADAIVRQPGMKTEVSREEIKEFLILHGQSQEWIQFFSAVPHWAKLAGQGGTGLETSTPRG